MSKNNIKHDVPKLNLSEYNSNINHLNDIFIPIQSVNNNTININNIQNITSIKRSNNDINNDTIISKKLKIT